ncbi:MAG: hypothetical protein P4L10_10915 [Acidobacteriaceae bacterium]|nr:hypothetical protein [Acidobacteriaceae bacterium]
MSGILSAIESAGQLFGGYGQVTLGPVQFSGVEVPESISLGGAQKLITFEKPGGQRTIQAMGRSDAPMSWAGYLEGPNAESRMQLLDSLRQSGAVIQLAFGQSSFKVVVDSFLASYKRSNWIPYRITVTVLQDNAASLASSPPSLLDSLNSDLNSAAGFDVAAAAQSAITDAVSVVNVAGALGLNTTAWTNAVGGLLTAQGLIGTEQLAATGSIAGVVSAAGTVGNMLGVTQIGNAASALTGVLSTTQTLAATTQAGAYVSRAIDNLMTVSA